jgi:hypothetical protein
MNVKFNVTARHTLRPDIAAAMQAGAPMPVLEKPKKAPTYNMSLAQIEAIKRQATREAVEQAWLLMLGLPVMVLHDKDGYGETRLNRFLDHVLDLYDSYEKGYLTLNDIREALKAETGSVVRKIETRRKYK